AAFRGLHLQQRGGRAAIERQAAGGRALHLEGARGAVALPFADAALRQELLEGVHVLQEGVQLLGRSGVGYRFAPAGVPADRSVIATMARVVGMTNGASHARVAPGIGHFERASACSPHPAGSFLQAFRVSRSFSVMYPLRRAWSSSTS